MMASWTESKKILHESLCEQYVVVNWIVCQLRFTKYFEEVAYCCNIASKNLMMR